ncbi:TetR family transcriptional regulator [Cypionkella aquatica]|uniref:TetR family transcriptional regulator n=2 Tax=Cypionkella aquatica TaxID=1756042 RepID=A0AA37TW87_9RHOB|nr:TetR family transcriptional regulator [Cypionkella aquatica]
MVSYQAIEPDQAVNENLKAKRMPQPAPEPLRPIRRNEIRQQNEQLILQAAEKVFAEAGFGGATMQLIADVAGLPKANLHYYFTTKEELYRKVVSNIFDIWLHAAESMDNAPGPVEGIGAYIDAKMEISRRHPDGSKVWASEVMHGAPVIQDYLETTLRDWTAGRVALIQGWIDAGQMAAVNPDHLLYMLWAATQHYADFGHQIETLNGGPLTDRQWAEAKDSVKAMILRGIGAA